MRDFRDIPIKQKLMVVVMLTTTAALLLSGVGIVLSDSFLFRRHLERDLGALGRIIADNSTAALAFDDARVAGETLAALRARDHIISACIYRTDGTVLARYLRPGADAGCPAPLPEETVRFSTAELIVSRPVLLNERRIGTLTMLYDLEEISSRIEIYSGTVAAVLLVSSLVALLISSRLRASIATPIAQLAGTARQVSETKDYSARAQKFSADELGVLVDSFNDMLAAIQSRDNELRSALLAREEALKLAQRARESLQTTLESIGDAVIATDLSGQVVFANPVAQQLLRLPESEIVGKPLEQVFNVVNEFTREKAENPAKRVLQEETVVGMANHTVLIAHDGTEIPIDDSGAPIRNANGAVLGTVLVFRDVTERRRAGENSRLLASIVESSADAIIGNDLNGNVTTWNRGAERMFGYTAEEMLGRPISILADPERSDDMPSVLERIRTGQRIDQYDTVRRTKSGKLINVSLTISPLYDGLGRMVGASKIARDITEQVRAAQRLFQLNADLQRSNESLARSNADLERFAFVASHDLQEPLRMITAYSQLLVKSYSGHLDEQAAMFVGNIVDGTRRMRELLADLLAYAEIGAVVDDAVESVDLNLVVEKVKQNLKVAIEDSGAEIVCDVLPVVSASESHLIPLFQNLIANAIKYRSETLPRIDVSILEGDGLPQFKVADNGIGIAPEYHEKIFAVFKRLHGKSIPGTGVGLAICQRVVERYGGRIWVESQPGKGSAFLFTLPRASLQKRRTV